MTKEKEKDKEKAKEKEKSKKEKDKVAKSEKGDKAEKADSDDDRKKRKRSKSPKVAEVSSDSEDEVGPDEFMVKLDMTIKKGLGVEVDWANGKSLLVKAVKAEGHIPDWNKEHPPSGTVMAEDHVISVNGKAGDPKAMLNLIRTSKKLKLLIWAHCQRSTEAPSKSVKIATARRGLADAETQLQESLARVQQKRRGVPQAMEFLVSLDMRHHPVLGLDVDWTNSKLLYIKALQPGAIEEWNRLNPPDRAVNPGDSVVAVNGYAGDSKGMAGLCKELCSAQNHLQLRVRGPPFPPPGTAPKLQIAS